MIRVLEKIEKKSIIFQHHHGLPRTANNSNVISFIKKRSEFGGIKYINIHATFDPYEDGSYDFPKYYRDTPEGFSIFMTKKEKVKIGIYIRNLLIVCYEGRVFLKIDKNL